MGGHCEFTLFHRSILNEDVVHDDGATSFCHQEVLEPHDPTGWDMILQMHLARSCIGMNEPHVPQLAAAFAELFNHGALIGFRNLDGQFLIAVSYTHLRA